MWTSWLCWWCFRWYEICSVYPQRFYRDFDWARMLIDQKWKLMRSVHWSTVLILIGLLETRSISLLRFCSTFTAAPHEDIGHYSLGDKRILEPTIPKTWKVRKISSTNSYMIMVIVAISCLSTTVSSIRLKGVGLKPSDTLERTATI